MIKENRSQEGWIRLDPGEKKSGGVDKIKSRRIEVRRDE